MVHGNDLGRPEEEPQIKQWSDKWQLSKHLKRDPPWFFGLQRRGDWDIDEYIVDNSAEKPKDWDDAAQGTWQPPLLKNPLYRGEWRPRKIPNPNYKGIWSHPQIANPEYVPDPSLSIYENISVIGLDLWQVRSGTIFDNFLITDDEKYAQKFGDETWGKTKKPEQAMSKKEIEKEKERKQRKTQKMPKKKPPQKNKSERIVAQKEEL